jgi:hypothetical protein
VIEFLLHVHKRALLDILINQKRQQYYLNDRERKQSK